eukprot:TRINITY_DN31819_c1_g2_i3.p1 TRINITY_DN31819_c1_g2~~TRINITY_DN31819_c1_g2_i3.p1  ORF type:complete len:326 (-),score=85.59 TRINITY_DN31819_c1_g2_i3:87-1064(-)
MWRQSVIMKYPTQASSQDPSGNRVACLRTNDGQAPGRGSVGGMLRSGLTLDCRACCEPRGDSYSQGAANGYVFLFFVFFFVVAVWNIVTSLFIERTMELAKPDVEDLMLLKRRHDLEDAKELMHLCRLVDMDNSNTISFDEFEQFMQNEELRQYFDVRGIDVKDADMFFRMLCAAAEVSGEEVDLETFIGGCMRLKGFASSIDVQTLAFESKLMHCMQKRFFQWAEQKLTCVEDELQHIRYQAAEGYSYRDFPESPQATGRGDGGVEMQAVSTNVTVAPVASLASGDNILPNEASSLEQEADCLLYEGMAALLDTSPSGARMMAL